ncbi:NnrS family protein [Rhodoplanes sp. Z2-YC6860]|uniref:NnrS family protein n=1 Tax=Rhodoplanes sp. Z2-YC6860 TaxID=674703 RepID=UPI00078B4E7C|nr:NnrS family protein [Rhodoplanes sp. Z2-YC6860]AMN41533.1 heme-Cu protein NnrS [Rhodoplanes sp. Z2-YC6860]
MFLSNPSVTPESRPRGGIPRLRPGSMPLLSYGFRPFFLGAGVWACIAMLLWIGLLSGHCRFATGYGAVAWHSHELLFGYVSAVLTGFLLTAIPNWTGRLPLQGSPLLGLVLLWLAGRVAMLMTDQIGSAAAAIIDGAYLFVLSGAVLREIITGKNWRNLKVVALTGSIAVANVIFHLEVIRSGAPDYGVRAAIAGIVTLIVLVGGRVIPSFTHNWLARRGDPNRPAPLGRLDFVAIGVTLLALVLWMIAPAWQGSGVALAAAAIMQAVRLSRWAGLRSASEPIVLILHLGYVFVPLGALALTVSIIWPEFLPPTGALHAWTSGAIGTMTLAIMTRAIRGHTGHDISSPPTTSLIYAAILLAALARAVAPLVPEFTAGLLYIAAAGWFTSFAIFVAVYGPMLVKRRRDSREYGC